jgi:hypothetical protein
MLRLISLIVQYPEHASDMYLHVRIEGGAKTRQEPLYTITVVLVQL